MERFDSPETSHDSKKPTLREKVPLSAKKPRANSTGNVGTDPAGADYLYLGCGWIRNRMDASPFTVLLR